MKKQLYINILFLLLCIPLATEAQTWRLQRYEASLGLGPTHSFMDIGSPNTGITSFQLPGTRPNVTLEAKFRIIQPLTVAVDLTYIQFGGVAKDDRLTVYSFVTNAFEPTATLEFNIFGDGRTMGSRALFNRRGMVNNYNNFSLYAFGGVGALMSKPKAFDSERNVVTNDPYFNNNSQTIVVFPVGLGVKYSIDSEWSIGLEVGGRFTMNDLIDGYTTPFSSANDKYILTNAKLVYKLRSNRNGLPNFRSIGRGR